MTAARFIQGLKFCAALTACFVSASTLADDEEYYDTWDAKMTGRYKLVWYYKTQLDFHRNQPNKVLVHNREFVVRPDVRPPTINGVYLLEYARINEGEEVLDLGTGTGLHAIFAADTAGRIVATDIYPNAILNARQNAKLHGVEDQIDFRVGDLFKPLKDGERFDVIFININFPFAVGDDRERLHDRFFSSVHKHMKKNARIYFQTAFIKNLPIIYEMLDRYNYRIMEMHMEHMPEHKHEPLFMMLSRRDSASR